MLFEWHKSLQNSIEDSIQKLTEYWELLGQNQFRLTDSGIKVIRDIKFSNSDDEILTAMDIAKKQYFKFENQMVTEESYTFAFSKIAGIIRGSKYDKSRPEINKLYYIRGILKNRIKYYFDENQAITILKEAYKSGLSIEELTEIAKRVRNWSGWKSEINKSIDEKKL
ncbi:MAG: hypothetical protein J5747_10825 [Spirochaetaceae bacterium]|nr:hypothetical protein [Spirochaetaceae bacterium]